MTEVHFTHRGKLNVVRSRMTEEQVAAAILADIAKNSENPDDPADPMDLMFTMVEVGGQEYYVAPHKGRLLADELQWKDMGVLPSGPFAGKQVQMPGPASEEEYDG